MCIRDSSVASSVAGAGFTLASLAPNSGYSIFNKHFVIHYAYYTVEIISRVVVLSVMFFTVDAYAYVVASLDFLVRLFFGYDVSRNLRDGGTLLAVQSFGSFIGYDISRNLRDGTLLAVQSFGSDHTEMGHC